MIVLPLSLFISLRFSRSRFHNRMISIVSMISTISISLGLIVLIIGLSIMNGFERELNNRILSVVPHGEIELIKQPWKNWNEPIRKINKIPGVLAVAPYVNFTALIVNKDKFRAIKIKGVDPKQEKFVNILPNFLPNKIWSNFKAGEKQIIIGKGISDILKIKQNDWISIIIPNIHDNHRMQEPRRICLHIVGIFQINSQFDYSFAMIPLQDASQYLKIGKGVTGITIKVNDIFNINKLICSIRKVTNDCINIKSWIDMYGFMYHDIQMTRTIVYLAMILVIGVACFNIVSTLIMAVKDKSSDIAILRTIGAKNSFIRTIFIWYGLRTGIVGSFYGVIIGVFVSLNLTPIFDYFEKNIENRILPKNIYFIDFLPSEVRWLDVIYILFIVLLLSVLVSWYPSNQASRINPAKILNTQ